MEIKHADWFTKVGAGAGVPTHAVPEIKVV